MKLETLKQKVSVIRGDDTEDRSFGIDGANMHLAIQAFYQYSDPIGSIIREITSNGYDAHIEAGTDKPVILKINKHQSAMHILDFGVGLSPDRVRDIFTKFFSSTKRETNDQIGAFGLGSKSPLSYTDMFEVITKYGDTVYSYVIHKADGVPNLVKVDEHPWREDKDPWAHDENGTEVVIPFKDKDYNQVVDSAKKQLKYFDNVMIQEESCQEFNQGKIFRGKHIIYRDSVEGEKLHICMGKVFYPLSSLKDHARNRDIDYLRELVEIAAADYGANTPLYDKLSTATSTGYASAFYYFFENLREVPIGLYFDIGELPILWHRENIEYTDQAWEKILLRALQAGFELEKLQLQEIGEAETLEDALRAEISSNPNLQIDPKVYMTDKALKVTNAKVAITELDNALASYEKSVRGYAKPLTFLSLFFEAHSDLRAPNARDLASYILHGKMDKNDAPVFRIEEGETRKPHLKAFMKGKKWEYLVVPKRNPTTITNELDIGDIHTVAVFEKYAQQAIELIEKLKQANDIMIPQHFHKQSVASQKSEIPVLFRGFHDGDSPQYRRDDLKRLLDPKSSRGYYYALGSMPSFMVYGHQDDRDKLDRYCRYNEGSLYRSAFGVGRSTSNYPILAVISKDTAEFIGDVLPAIHIEDFMHHRRAISNIVTRHLLGLYEQKYPWFTDMLDGELYTEWEYLRKRGMITDEEKQRIIKITKKGQVFTEDHPMYPYILHGLKHRYFHYDEIQAYQWAHGMYAKYAKVLFNGWIKFDPEVDKNPAFDYYYHEATKELQLTINPILYRKYHVNNIET